MGQLIAIEGPDSTGKRTQTGLLVEYLRSIDKAAKPISFPVYNSKTIALLKMYLSGEIGTLEEFNPYVSSTFFANDRYISYSSDWKKDYCDGSIIVSDRYTGSNLIHQMTYLPEDEWDVFINWAHDLEYIKYKLPIPDMIIYLDMDPVISNRLMNNRNRSKDMYEDNTPHLIACRKSASYAADKIGWVSIKCDDGINPYPMDEIHKLIAQNVNLFLNKK